MDSSKIKELYIPIISRSTCGAGVNTEGRQPDERVCPGQGRGVISPNRCMGVLPSRGIIVEL